MRGGPFGHPLCPFSMSAGHPSLAARVEWCNKVSGSAPTRRRQTLRLELMEQKIPCARREKPVYKMCRSHRRLCALFEHSAHENRGTSQILHTPMMKLPTVSGFLHSVCAPLTKIAERRRQAFCTPMTNLLTVSGFLHSTHENCGTSGVLHPHEDIADSFGLEIAERLRLSAPPR